MAVETRNNVRLNPPKYTAVFGATVPTTPELIKVIRFSDGVGAQPRPALIQLPLNDATTNVDWDNGHEVKIFRDSKLVWRGHTTDSSGSIGGTANSIEIEALDIRHAMDRQPIGAYGVGPTATRGGWPQVGYDLEFNPGGVPNKSASPSSSDVPEFDSTSSAEAWTYADILQFLHYWYVDDDICAYRSGLWTGPFKNEAVSIRMSVASALDAIDRVVRIAGGNISLHHSTASGQSFLRPVHPQISLTASYVASLAGPGDEVDMSTLSATNVKWSRSSRSLYDRIEIHSGYDIVETSYESGAALNVMPLLKIEGDTADIPDDMICMFRPDVTKYAANSLGTNLPAGSKPRPFLAELVTRAAESASDYVSAPVEGHEGERLRATHAIWMATGAGPGFTYQRVKSGVRIDHRNATIYVKRKVQVYGSTLNAKATTLTFTDPDDVNVVVTLAAHTDEKTVSRTQAKFLNLSSTKVVHRRDLNSEGRINSYLPDPAAADPNTQKQYSASAIETYVSVVSTIDALEEQMKEAAPRRDINVSMTFPFCPSDMQIGDGLSFSPSKILRSQETLRIVSMSTDAIRLDMAVTAASKIPGVA